MQGGCGCCDVLTPDVPLCPPRFMEAQIHDKEVLIEKLTLKNTTNKAAIAKLEAQLAHKEEMGEVRGKGGGAAPTSPNTAVLT